MNSTNMGSGDGNIRASDSSPTPGSDMGMSGSGDVRTAGQPLSDFLLQLEDYTPTVSIICHELTLNTYYFYR